MAISPLSSSRVSTPPSLPSLNSSSGAGKSQFSKDVASLKSDLLNFNSGKGQQVEKPAAPEEAAQAGEAAGEESSIQKLLQEIVGLLQQLLSKLGGGQQPGAEGAPEGAPTEGAPAPVEM